MRGLIGYGYASSSLPFSRSLAAASSKQPTLQGRPAGQTAQILSNVIGGVLKLPIGRILNLRGRAESLFVFTVVYLVGIIILACCNGPHVFAAGYILYWVGYDALYLILDLFIADTFGLRNRAFAFGFASTPFICTAFTGPLAAQSFINRASWRWAYGAFAIIIPVVFLPLMLVSKHYQKKAEGMGIYRRRPSGRTFGESVIYYIREFDRIYLLFVGMAANETDVDIQHSGRRHFPDVRFCPRPSSIRSPELRSSPVQDSRVHLYARGWSTSVLGIRHLGAILHSHPLRSL